MAGRFPDYILGQAASKEITARVDDNLGEVEDRYSGVGLGDEGDGVEEGFVAGGEDEVVAVRGPGGTCHSRLEHHKINVLF